MEMAGPVPEILFRDDRIIVVNKPCGLLSVPGIGPARADCVAARVAAAHPGARIVHRLDRDTSGVLVMALDAEAHRAISIRFQDRLVDKRYVAVVTGVLDREEGVIDLPLARDPDRPPRHRVDPQHGRSSLTRWRVVGGGEQTTRLELNPRTGRSHQIRVHLMAIGHPILGDDLYAPPAIRDRADRLLLHARSLRLAHPGTAAPMSFAAACPF